MNYPATQAEIRPYVRAHLLAQNRQSLTRHADYMCAYRGRNGTSCAVGCLIKAEFYSPSIEGKTVYDIRPILRQSLGFEPDWDELNHFQTIHDSYDPQHWEGLFNGTP